MSQIFVDGSLLAKFASQTGEVEVCDSSGRVLGVFVPAAGSGRELSDRELYEQARASISDEELERRRREPGGYTTAEVLDYLKGL